MATERNAGVRWQGSLLEGSGTIESTTSGAFGGLGVTWKARSDDEHGGLTSPEELIAAAHAACLSMALSGGGG
jgi:lipoyl-dependent peroxiredoxin